MNKLLLIINPQSGRTQIKTKLLEITNILIQAGYQIELYITQCKLDAKRVVEERGQEYDIIVCSGGDGTLNEVVNGIMNLQRKPLMGYLPSGSTNDFAASQGIHSDPLHAIKVITQAKSSAIDVGCFNGKYFTYVAAFGMLTEVPYVTPRETKAVLGYQAYLLEGVKRLGKIEKRHLLMTVDNQHYEGDVLIGMVSNASRIGGMKGISSRDTQLDDGKFEVLLIDYSANPLKFTKTVTGLFVPEVSAELIHRFEGSHITFSFDEPTEWVLDGEFGGSQRKVTIDVVKCGLQIIK